MRTGDKKGLKAIPSIPIPEWFPKKRAQNFGPCRHVSLFVIYAHLKVRRTFEISE